MSLLIFAFDGSKYCAIDEAVGDGCTAPAYTGARRKYIHDIIYDAAIDGTKDFFIRIFNGGYGVLWY